MLGIGTIISLAASAFQVVQTLNRPDPAAQKTDELFAQLDASGKGSFDKADLQSAFDKLTDKAVSRADQLFARLDTDRDGKVTKEEFSNSINRLAEQLDEHYMRLRIHGEQAEKAEFTQDELKSVAASLADNFSKADTDGNGKVSIREAVSFLKTNPPASASPLAPVDPKTAAAPTGQENVEMMLQVMRLMQAYGTNHGTDGNNNRPKISVSA